MAKRWDDIGFGGITLLQDTEQFCYGVDAVLLANFAAEFWNNKRITEGSLIDLGTNNGVIALLLSYLTNASRIIGIDIQEKALNLAKRTVVGNHLENRINIEYCDVLSIFEKFPAGSFDMVVSNPPYGAKGTGNINLSNAKAVARHETTAELRDFIKAASYLLKDNGHFCIVHRPSRLTDLICACRENLLEPKIIRFVSPHMGEIPNIMLVSCKKNAGRELKFMKPLAIYGDDGNYTAEINRIYERL